MGGLYEDLIEEGEDVDGNGGLRSRPSRSERREQRRRKAGAKARRMSNFKGVQMYIENVRRAGQTRREEGG